MAVKRKKMCGNEMHENKRQARNYKKICLQKKIKFSMNSLFSDLQLQDEVESLIGVFLNV